MTDRVPTKPFQDWIEKRIALYEKQAAFGGEIPVASGAFTRTAFDLGLREHTLRDFREGVMSTRRDGKLIRPPVKTFSRERVEEALWRADAFLWDAYPPDEYPELYEGVAA